MAIGHVIGGRYRVERRLGAGGMGTVFLAEQLSIGRKVALKILRAELADDEGFVSRFRREAKLVAILNERRSPHVTFVHDFDQTEDGSFFIVMEWLEGQVLSDVIKQEGMLELRRAVRLATQIAEGLEAAHSASVIHRDIKPSNIMVLTGTDDIKLMDFGLARLRDSSSGTQLTQTGVMMGTPAYMSPEQIEGDEATTRIDIYSFGLVFYEMLTGMRPFRADTAAALLAKHLRERPEPPSRVRPEIPPEIDALILTALEKDPARRQDMGEIVRGLGEVTRRLTNAPTTERSFLGAPTGAPGAVDPVAVPRPPDGEPSQIPLPSLDETQTSSPAAEGAGLGARGPAERAQRATRALSGLAGWRGYLAAIVGGGTLVALLVASWAHFFVPSSSGPASAGAYRAPSPVPAGLPSPPDRPIEARAAPAQALALGALHALVVGNGDYTSFRRLRTAVNDAEAVASMLGERYGFKVNLLRNATRAQMMSALHELRQRLAESDNLLIYYAGHGEIDPVSQRSYWVPVDAEADNTLSWISDSDVSELVNVMAARRLLVVADSCYAARSTAVLGPSEPMSQEDSARAFRSFGAMRARVVLISGGMEPVLDSGGGKHSLFAQSFLQSLDANEGVLLGRALFQRIQGRVQAMSQRWTVPDGPQYAAIRDAGHAGGDFFFQRTGQ